MEFSFSYKPIPPFRLDLTVWALRRRADNWIDRWDGQVYRRVLALENALVEVLVVQDGPPDIPELNIKVRGSASEPGLMAVIQNALDHLLGAQIELTEFYRFAEAEPILSPLIRKFRGFKPPRFPTLYEALTNAIACQQITLTQGIRLLNRLAEEYGASFSGQDEQGHAFPIPSNLVSLEPETLRALGFSRQKATALIGLSRDISRRKINLTRLYSLDDKQAIDDLCQIRGVGRWTAEYVLLRGMGRLNIFPGDDVGARNHLQSWLRLQEPLTYLGVQHVVEPWKPFAGLIYFHLLLKRLDEEGYLSSNTR
jgi:DNA-3-methyladenine glycosylase II